jgi:hypothetical protein
LRIAPLLCACLLFWVNSLDVFRGWIQPPAGHSPLFVPRDTDIAQHLTWMAGLHDRWLIPDFHAPYVTAPGMVAPLMTLLGRIAALGFNPALVYTAAQFAFYVLGAYAALYCFRVFLTSRRQVYAALICAFCMVGTGDFGRLARIVSSGAITQTAIGGLEPDGFLIRGALSLTIGTVSVILAVALLGAYVTSGRKVLLYGVALVATISALFHPFEVIAIMLGTVFSLLVLRWPRWFAGLRESLVVCAPAVAALIPYAYASLRVDWVGELAKLNRPEPLNPARLLYRLGVPAVLAVVLMAVGPRMHRRTDVLLKCWFGASFVALMLPYVPFRFHLTDGLAFITSLLVVRQVSTISAQHWPRRYRVAISFVGATIIVASIAIHVLHRYVAWRQYDATAPEEEVLTVNWLRQHARPEELVLAPPESAPWIATTPIHTFASHWLSSFDYWSQLHLAQSFYSGGMNSVQAQAFLSSRGINFVVVPAASSAARLLDRAREVTRIRTWVIYYFPENHMPPYTLASALPRLAGQ